MGAALTFDGVLDGPRDDRHETARQTTTALFEENRTPLVRYLIHIGVPAGDVEEAVQTAFLRLFEHLLAQGPSTNLRAWLFRVARNHSLNVMKHERRFVPAGRETDQAGPMTDNASYRSGEHQAAAAEAQGGAAFLSPDLADGRMQPDEALLEWEKHQRLRQALEKLTPTARECLHLRAAGLRYREIAAVAGIAVSTVAGTLRQALEQLEEECHG